MRTVEEAFRGQRDRLTARQLAAIRIWQRTDRSYELVQGLLRGTIDVETLSRAERAHAERLTDDLGDAIECGRTSRPLTVYRGIRSLRRTFGVDRAGQLPKQPDPFRGFTATSIHRDVAVTEFTTTSGAILEIEVPEGTRALWVAGAGEP